MAANGDLKGQEHRILGWTVLTQTYNLEISLSEELWCWMSDFKKYYDNIFKKLKKCIRTKVLSKSFFCPIGKKMISPYIEWCIRKCPFSVFGAHNFL